MNKVTISLILFALLINVACDENFEDINTNPNAVTEIDDGYLFANTVLNTLRGDNNTRTQFPFGFQFAHIYVGQNQAMFIDRYYDNFTSADYKSLFESYYYNPIRLVRACMLYTQPGGENENKVRHAMAQTISFISFSRLADAFGSIPYREGGIGQEDIIYPEYDPVEYIYKDMLESLKKNVEILQVADPENGYKIEDPLYNNDLKKWARFANSLRLRLAMRIRFVDSVYANQVIQECLALPLIEELNQSVGAENKDSDLREFGNPMYNTYQYWQWKMSEKFVNTLKSNNDPRLEIFVKPNSDGEYLGIPNGLSDQEFTKWIWAKVSDPADHLVSKWAPSTEMSAAEIWFLRAEAALFNLGPGDANELYRTAISKSLEQWNIDEEEITDFMNNEGTTSLSGSVEQQFEQICTQHWIAVVPNAFEGWTNIRRTGYPKIAKRTTPKYDLGVSDGELPKRVRYPSSEMNMNKQNYSKAVEQQGPDLITTPIWWDVRD